MREKGAFRRNLNMRAVKAGLYGLISRWPLIRNWLNYYQDTIAATDLAEAGSVRELRIRPVEEYGLDFSESELNDVLRSSATEMAALTVTFRKALVADVTILGSSGVSVVERLGKALSLATIAGGVPRNWRVARPLTTVVGDEDASYINLLGVRVGHRHFAHFFWDTLAPLMVYLKHWHDRTERTVVLIRDDLSPIQRDAYRFLAEDYPELTFEGLPADRKIRCAKTIWLMYDNRRHSVDNTLARDVMRDVAGLFLKHYGIAERSSGEGKRLYLSRQSAALRQTRNEPALVQMLSRYGFEAVDTGRMPFREQARLFASADVIVAPHGAALANLMFCRPGTKMLEFFPANYLDDCYCRLSRSLGLDYHHLFGGKGSRRNLAFVMDPDVLEAAVAEMLDE